MDTSGDGYTSLTVDQSHVTQGQRPQGFGHVDPAGHVTQVPLPPGGGVSWPGYPGHEASPAIYLEPQVTSAKTYAAYRQRASTALGALQITAALLSTILNIVGIVIEANESSTVTMNIMFYFAYGIWCSWFYIISGSLAIHAGKRARRGVVIGSTVMSTISAVIVWCHIGMASASTAIDAINLSTGTTMSIVKASLGLSSVLLILGILEFIVTVWTASLGCAVTCCGSQATKVVTQTKVVFVQGPQQHSGHDGNTQRPVPGNPSAYPTYSTSSPEAVYYTIPDNLPEVRGQSMSRNTTDVYLTTDHSSPAGRHHYLQVVDQPDVRGVPPSSDGVYAQPKTHFNRPRGVDMYLTTNTATGGNR